MVVGTKRTASSPNAKRWLMYLLGKGHFPGVCDNAESHDSAGAKRMPCCLRQIVLYCYDRSFTILEKFHAEMAEIFSFDLYNTFGRSMFSFLLYLFKILLTVHLFSSILLNAA